ncbi:MAG: hypothetical protein F4Y86_12740 [Gammaproteobacteria bacterium]|nr:hypothetical protein [Gammaproteobacteria bacterium]MXY53375.1 hypothetical protein [Gammaproteobacteria bacterium]
MQELAQAMSAAIRAGEPLPKMPEGLSLDDAYALQKDVVAQVADGDVSGLKAGMTAPAGQQAFGLTHPLIGSLYGAGRLEPGATFEGLPGVSLECEIGIVVDANGAPKTAGPVIEVPRMAFADEADRNGANLTACNIAADRYIVGEQQPLRDSYGDIQVTLTRDGEQVTTAPATDALGGPHAALAWMLNEANVRGLAIEDGMLLITGACGGIHPATPGHYVADYGSFGTIEFTVT